MRLDCSTVSGIGTRSRNEDAALTLSWDGGDLVALCDGLGGHPGGAEAARICLDGLAGLAGLSVPDPERLAEALAGVELRLAAERVARRWPAGTLRTTVAVLLRTGNKALCMHVGDTRLYWFRRGTCLFRTRDHSVAELAAAGGPGMALPDKADRNRLLRAVGGEGRPAFAPALFDLAVGDAFLLCTDGAWDVLEQEADGLEIPTTDIAADIWVGNLDRRICNAMAASAGADFDNYTLIGARVVH